MVRLGLGWGRVRARVGASGGVRDKGWEIVRDEVRVGGGVRRRGG